MIRAAFKNPHLIVVMALAVLVVGITSYQKIPADLLPIFRTPAVQIVTFYPGMPPEVMERDIMSRLERWTGQSVGIEHQEAKAMQGVCVVKDFFREDISNEEAMAQVALSYLQLVRAKSRAAILEVAVQHSERLAKITADFAQAGEGYEADAQRAVAALASQRRELLRNLEDEQVASSQLARLLRLDPTIRLLPTDQHTIPIDMVSTNNSLDNLIGQAIAARPEVSRQESIVAESYTRIDQEHWRPLLPNVYAGFNGGGFGGSGGSNIANFSDKTDFDIAAVWQLENFGFGNAARRRMQDSRHRQAHFAREQARDTVASQVTEAYSRVQSRKKQIAAAAIEIEAADRALGLNFDGIRGAVLRPIEAQQAIDAFVDARLAQLDTVLAYNSAQLELLRAIGLPPHAAVQP